MGQRNRRQAFGAERILKVLSSRTVKDVPDEDSPPVRTDHKQGANTPQRARQKQSTLFGTVSLLSTAQEFVEGLLANPHIPPACLRHPCALICRLWREPTCAAHRRPPFASFFWISEAGPNGCGWIHFLGLYSCRQSPEVAFPTSHASFNTFMGDLLLMLVPS